MMARTRPAHASSRDAFPATARLRAGILVAPDAEALVSMFAEALAEHGLAAHFCVRKVGETSVPILGDSPELIGREKECIAIDAQSAFLRGCRMLLARPALPLGQAGLARLKGYAELYAARALALQELADDVETDCGLTLRERYVLGRRLAGLAPIDIAAESGVALATVSAAIDTAIRRLGADSLAEAISLAARRGWLAVTSLENCSSSSLNLTYKALGNG